MPKVNRKYIDIEDLDPNEYDRDEIERLKKQKQLRRPKKKYKKREDDE